MSPTEFAEFLRIAKDAGVESFQVGELKVAFAASPMGPLGADSPLNRWTDKEWALAHTEGLPVPDDKEH